MEVIQRIRTKLAGIDANKRQSFLQSLSKLSQASTHPQAMSTRDNEILRMLFSSPTDRPRVPPVTPANVDDSDLYLAAQVLMILRTDMVEKESPTKPSQVKRRKGSEADMLEPSRAGQIKKRKGSAGDLHEMSRAGQIKRPVTWGRKL